MTTATTQTSSIISPKCPSSDPSADTIIKAIPAVPRHNQQAIFRTTSAKLTNRRRRLSRADAAQSSLRTFSAAPSNRCPRARTYDRTWSFLISQLDDTARRRVGSCGASGRDVRLTMVAMRNAAVCTASGGGRSFALGSKRAYRSCSRLLSLRTSRVAGAVGWITLALAGGCGSTTAGLAGDRRSSGAVVSPDTLRAPACARKRKSVNRRPFGDIPLARFPRLVCGRVGVTASRVRDSAGSQDFARTGLPQTDVLAPRQRCM